MVQGLLFMGFQRSRNKEANWSSSSYLIVGSYDRKGYSLWLNKGSKICMRWATQTSRSDKIEILLIKERIGEDSLLPELTFPFYALFLNEQMTGKEAEYTIDEDGHYYVGVTNSNPRSITMTFNLTVTAMVYDVSKATSVCSALNGSCYLDLQFPNTHYVVVSTADNSDIDGRYVELSFDNRDISYIALLEEDNDDGTGSSRNSSVDLNDAKLCIICYDDERNCFFIPCGHSATCFECAKRVMEEDNKMCPICRKLIRKAKKTVYSIGANGAGRRWRPLQKCNIGKNG
ncbi:RING/U-box superfamily protein isoform 3 [Hibiscus syriacus]|uniref:RING/U-box superfamily protein isoform 3 n=1 Tax=Hibiscus syriacus TaxID=106335 RepID=A0A6A3BER9_HIBSY|nr:RING/U-box superfamily protein isoform 3 [Hibiscus syriacus]